MNAKPKQSALIVLWWPILSKPAGTCSPGGTRAAGNERNFDTAGRAYQNKRTVIEDQNGNQQNVMDTIVNIAKVSNNINATSYGAQGRYSPLDNSKNALAVNRTL